MYTQFRQEKTTTCQKYTKNALNNSFVEILKHTSIPSFVKCLIVFDKAEDCKFWYTVDNACVPMIFTGYTDRQLMDVSMND